MTLCGTSHFVVAVQSGLAASNRYVQAVVWASDDVVLVLTLNRPQNESFLLVCNVTSAVAGAMLPVPCIVSLHTSVCI
jgi:hypothetical protein